jgi:hypothetical protein
MRHTRLNLSTSLTTQDLGVLFKETTTAMHGVAGKVAHVGRSMSRHATKGFGYYRPHGDEFSVLDDDLATFEIGVHLPTFSGTNGGGVTLHMYVWDRGDHREVQLVTPHGVISGASKSKRRLRQFVEAIQQHDPALAVAA